MAFERGYDLVMADGSRNVIVTIDSIYFCVVQ